MKNLKLFGYSGADYIHADGWLHHTGDPAVSSNGNTNDNVGGDIPYESICFASDTIDEFIDWVKSDGQKDVGRNGSLEYPANKNFIDWAKNRDSLVIPIVKNDSFHIHAATIFSDEDAYNIVYTTYHPDMVNPQNSSNTQYLLSFS